MTITFSLASDTEQPDPVAVIDATQLAAFCTFLRSESERRRQPFLDPEHDGDGAIPERFEARICPIALATIARLFGYDEQVITVVEEAQFRGRRVGIWHDGARGELRMRVSPTSDLGLEFTLANGNAYALLEAIGIKPDSVGSIPATEVLDRLAKSTTLRRLSDRGVRSYAERLRALLTSQTQQDETLMAWA